MSKIPLSKAIGWLWRRITLNKAICWIWSKLFYRWVRERKVVAVLGWRTMRVTTREGVEIITPVFYPWTYR